MLDVVEAKARYYYQAVRIIFYDYFLEMLSHLKEKKVPMVVVTGGNKERVGKTIKEHLDGYFDDLVTIDDVKNGKPHPEPFLKGADKLGLKASECIVIENAPLGIKSAKAAQCLVIAIKTTLDEKYLNEADIICDTFRQVEEKLLTLLKI
jgi:beta-phosphoglucomutase